MLPDYDLLFADQAEKYDRFVSAEDHEGNLLPAVRRLGRLNREQAVADLGTGTGRIAFLVAPIVRHVYGIEPVGGMRSFAELKKKKLGVKNVDFLPGEHRDIPLPDHSVDLVIEGWAFLRAFSCAYPGVAPGVRHHRAGDEADTAARRGGCLYRDDGISSPLGGTARQDLSAV